MKLRIKAALFALSAGLIALESGTCFFRFLGDQLGDWLWLRNIN
jgi:hypothetical protein